MQKRKWSIKLWLLKKVNTILPSVQWHVDMHSAHWLHFHTVLCAFGRLCWPFLEFTKWRILTGEDRIHFLTRKSTYGGGRFFFLILINHQITALHRYLQQLLSVAEILHWYLQSDIHDWDLYYYNEFYKVHARTNNPSQEKNVHTPFAFRKKERFLNIKNI